MAARPRISPLDVLVLSAWCGLAGGLLEVGTRVLCKILPSQRMYMMSRHFIWLAPLSNLLIFGAVGLVLALATKLWPARGRLALLAAGLLLGDPARNHCDESRNLSASNGDPGGRDLGSFRADSREPSGPGAALALPQFPRPFGSRSVSGRIIVGKRLAQAAARAEPSLAPRGSAERAFDRAGHRTSRPAQSLRLPPAHQPHTRFVGQAGYPLRHGAHDSPVDPSLACEHVHRPLAP